MTTAAEPIVYIVVHQACKHPVAGTAVKADAEAMRRELGMWAAVREGTDEDLLTLLHRHGTCNSCRLMARRAAMTQVAQTRPDARADHV